MKTKIFQIKLYDMKCVLCGTFQIAASYLDHETFMVPRLPKLVEWQGRLFSKRNHIVTDYEEIDKPQHLTDNERLKQV